ncbi:MAG: phosphatidate cytidylyltransferase [Aquabacterium sp.]
MLAQRVLTALVLLALLLPALFADSPLPFLLVTLVLMVPAAWEWSHLNSGGGWRAWLCSALMLLACAAWLMLGIRVGGAQPLWWAALAGWVLLGAAALKGGVGQWAGLPASLRWLAGLALLWTAWSAMAHARVIGINFLLSVLCIVWAADIAAYFGGRRWGCRKLAPAISPGKSWAGVYSGLVGTLVLALVWMAAEARLPVDSPSFFFGMVQRHGWLPMLLAVVLLAALSVVGDLFESLVKRAAGAKDSGRLLPGHGGVLDRVDALLPTLPAALALWSV